MKRKLLTGLVIGGTALAIASPAGAQEEVDPLLQVQANLDNTFVLIAAALVIFMQVGFALLESGLTRAKNAANIAMKNLADFAVGALLFFAVGYALAYGGDGALIGGSNGFFLGGGIGDGYDPTDYTLTLGTDFLFQVAFAATAATIMSGVMAERTKFVAYVIAAGLLAGIIYPIIIHWNWGGGWLSTLDTPFQDFAGSGLVHMTGGVAGLMGAIFLGARIGKYGPDGKPRAILGHNMPFAMFGTFILFVGWFGFNGGSVLAADESIGDVALNTALAAAAGAVAATAVIWAIAKKPDVGMACNGLLGGLVGITASADVMSYVDAMIIGLIAGVIVVASVLGLDRLKVDDPVGAVSVHATCGLWGLVAVGFFGELAGGSQLVTQLIGAGAIIGFTVVTMGAVFAVLKATMGLRVSEQVEVEGLDVHEHGSPGYNLGAGEHGPMGAALTD